MIGKILSALIAIPALLLVAIGLSALYAWPVQLLWNALVPSLFPYAQVFGITEYAPYHITFLQAWGMTLLTSFLFKSSK